MRVVYPPALIQIFMIGLRVSCNRPGLPLPSQSGPIEASPPYLGSTFPRPTPPCPRRRGPLKPAPDIFVEAARRLKLDPRSCLVIEDALTGVATAKSAGSRCLGITSSFSDDQLKATGADLDCPEPGISSG